VLYIIGAAVTPSIIGLTLCFISLWLPDDGYVLSKPCDDRQDSPNATKMTGMTGAALRDMRVTFNRRELDSPEPIQA
jgi:hypothetical protein